MFLFYFINEIYRVRDIDIVTFVSVKGHFLCKTMAYSEAYRFSPILTLFFKNSKSTSNLLLLN